MAISPESKMRTPDRVLTLKPKDGKKAKDTLGNLDPRLFNGENKLHAVMDTQTTLWKLKYEMGSVPEPLKCSFTSFKALRQHAEEYFNKRNIEITEVA